MASSTGRGPWTSKHNTLSNSSSLRRWTLVTELAGHQQPGGQMLQHVMEGLVGMLAELPHQTGVQRLLVQGGLQVNADGIAVLFILPHMGAGAEDQRSGQAEVGEQQLPLLLEDGLAPLVLDPHRHIAQGEPLHLGALLPFDHQGDQGGPGRQDGMPQLRRHAVAVAGGAGQRIGAASRGQHGRSAGISAALPFYAGDAVLRGQQAHRPVLHDGHLLAPQSHEKRVDDIRRPVGLRKNPAAAFRLERDAQAGKEFLHGGGRKAGHSAGKKTTVMRDVGERLVRRTVVGKVTAAFPCDIELPAHLLVALQKDDGSA